MGYKLAGYEHLGGVEIDPKIADVYRENHKPKYLYVEDIRLFNKRNDLSAELFSLDLLDGSPPCSTFSMAGSREKAWGKKKQFREGQAVQVLDDLVFEYVRTIDKLQPKVCLLENVRGIIQGNAKAYSKEIVMQMHKAGYRVQVFLLNAASMGVPQKRERVFFIGLRKDFDLPELKMRFDERPVLFGEFRTSEVYTGSKGKYYSLWEKRKEGDTCIADIHERVFGNRSGMNTKLCHSEKVFDTLVSGSEYHDFETFGYVKMPNLAFIGSYPLDYNFKTIEPKYLIGMSVPPVMTAQIANQIWIQWLSKIKSKSE